MTFVERRAQRDPSVPMRTVRDVGTGQVLGHFRVPEEVTERVVRLVAAAQVAETRPTFEPLTADGYQRLLDSIQGQCGVA